VDIVDRSLLVIGDDVVFGDRVACYCHLVKRRGDGLLLYVRRVQVGDGVLLGAGCRLGPGVKIDDRAVIESRTDVMIGRRVRAAAA
jgi:acetyltransferase-like isoleucine patch superfamily enzyme